jgi:hypothetical protein
MGGCGNDYSCMPRQHLHLDELARAQYHCRSGCKRGIAEIDVIETCLLHVGVPEVGHRVPDTQQIPTDRNLARPMQRI